MSGNGFDVEQDPGPHHECERAYHEATERAVLAEDRLAVYEAGFVPRRFPDGQWRVVYGVDSDSGVINPVDRYFRRVTGRSIMGQSWASRIALVDTLVIAMKAAAKSLQE